ncbi:cell division protein FtsQ/DivIB [Brachybacterium sp. AOP43-C2-M15]|uniref:cell division protein FtsQ/DivIB n=1 Tax=Brachybacterium sp. AOP43-C2-M15 TaxID=3457661 RepID=UPI004034381A
MVQAAGRFREMVVGRPWRRRRRAILAGAAATVLVLVAALVTAIFLPALQVEQVAVEGTGYVQEEDVRAAVDPHLGRSILLLPEGAISAGVAEVPGIAAVEVERDWPDGVRVTVTESEPVGLLTRTDGSTAVVDAEGEELPGAAGEGAELVPLTVDPAAADPDGAAIAMSRVLAGMPEPLRGAVQEVTASSASDVTVVLALEDGGSKTVVWGDAHDAELKAEVVEALLDSPGTVIDVSSPVAPVTR